VSTGRHASEISLHIRKILPWARCGRAADGDTAMMDVVMLAIGVGFFALSVGYAIACDRL
jgi:hypothetical protein